MDQLRNSVQKGQASLGGIGLEADLQTILDSFGGIYIYHGWGRRERERDNEIW